MTSKELDCFMAVAENHSYVKSASILYYSQPTITYQIRSLEEELGFDLFETHDRTELTPSGRVLYKHLKTWHRQWNTALITARSASNATREVLQIETRRLIHEDIFTDGLGLFYNSQKTHGFKVHTFHIGGMVQDLLQGVRDISVADSAEIEGNDDLCYQPLCRSCWGFAVSRKDPLSEKKLLEFSDLNGKNVILPGIPAGMDETPFDKAIRHGMVPAEIQYSNSHENAVMTAATGIAVASVNYSVASQHAGLVFLPVRGFDHCTHGLAWRADDNRECVKSFVDAMKQVFLNPDGSIPSFI